MGLCPHHQNKRGDSCLEHVCTMTHSTEHPADTPGRDPHTLSWADGGEQDANQVGAP